VSKRFHSKVDKSDKRKILEDWLNGEVHVVCATTSFSMGIHNAKVEMTFIVHATLPFGVSAYLQQIGRGGRLRADSVCECVVLVHEEEDVRSLKVLLRPKTKKSDETERIQKEAEARMNAILTVSNLVVRVPVQCEVCGSHPRGHSPTATPRTP
jgi:superfamily II DNA helicase RecQ